MNSLPLGDVSVEQFLAEYWQKKPLLIRNAMPGVLPPIGAEELAGLACEELMESRLVVHDGASEKWELTHGPFTEETFRTLPEQHWTLLVQAVDFWVPAAATFLDQFTFIPSWRVDDLMISLSGEGGGVGPHFDHYDVFLVQVQGRRQWEIGGVYDEHSPRRSDTPVMILAEWRPHDRWILEPGDLLYVPPRVGHSGIAVGQDCMTCSVGFRAPSHSDMLREFADFIGVTLGEGVRYADPDLVLQANPGHITPAALKKAQNILRQYVEDNEKIAEWFGRSVTIPKYDEEPTSSEFQNLNELRTRLSEHGMLVRNEGSRFAYQEHGPEVWFFADGHCHRCSRDQSDLVKQLCAERLLDAKKFVDSDDDLRVLQNLLDQGSLYFPE